MIAITNEDNMALMARYPDKHFELAIVDPPYGDGGGVGKQSHDHASGDVSTGTASESQPCLRGTVVRQVQRTGGGWSAKYQSMTGGIPSASDIRHWDYAPPNEFFDELFRVSKAQIIWGGNYFSLPPTRNFIIWRKLTMSEDFSMAMAEYAWTNIQGNAKVFECAPQGNMRDRRIHPTQKPIALYKWLLSRYAKQGDKILDTHLGSGSIAIACHDMGFDLTACELDADYYAAAMKRLATHQQQATLFDPREMTKSKQEQGLFA